jgi:hypothetical protein
MSVINVTGSDIKSTTLPNALLEACLLLDNREKSRNGLYPSLPPKNNVTITFSSDDSTASIAASLPVNVVIEGTTIGGIIYDAKPYLGAAFDAATPGGSLTSTSLQGQILQIAQMLSNAEKQVTPLEDQPNFVQVESSSESGVTTVTATLPFTLTILDNGGVNIVANDYL